MSRRTLTDERGFTLIELLTVILIIAILAAIAIPALRNQQNRAHDADAKVAVRNAYTAMETWFVDTSNYAATAADLRAIEPALAQGAASTLTVTPGVNDYTVEVTAVTGNKWRISKVSGTGIISRTCVRVSRHGSCPATGTW